MTQAVIRRHFRVEARVRSQASPCEFCDGQSGSGTGVSARDSVVSLLVSFRRCSILFMYMFLLPAGQTGEAWEPLKQQCCVGTQGALDRKVLSFLLLFLMLNHFNFENLCRSREDSSGGLKWWKAELLQPVTDSSINHVNKRF